MPAWLRHVMAGPEMLQPEHSSPASVLRNTSHNCPHSRNCLWLHGSKQTTSGQLLVRPLHEPVSSPLQLAAPATGCWQARTHQKALCAAAGLQCEMPALTCPCLHGCAVWLNHQQGSLPLRL